MNARQHLLAALARGETVRGYRESGNSMTPIIEHRQPVDLAPIVDPAKLTRRDIVFCTVHGRYYLHLILAADRDKVMIGSNKGRINGWTARSNVHGIVVAIDGRPRRNSQHGTPHG